MIVLLLFYFTLEVELRLSNLTMVVLLMAIMIPEAMFSLLYFTGDLIQMRLLFFFFFFLVIWGLNSELHTCKALYRLSHISSPSCSGYFGDEVLQTISLSWPQTAIMGGLLKRYLLKSESKD
jgi:hypothetical protein